MLRPIRCVANIGLELLAASVESSTHFVQRRQFETSSDPRCLQRHDSRAIAQNATSTSVPMTALPQHGAGADLSNIRQDGWLVRPSLAPKSKKVRELFGPRLDSRSRANAHAPSPSAMEAASTRKHLRRLRQPRRLRPMSLRKNAPSNEILDAARVASALARSAFSASAVTQTTRPPFVTILPSFRVVPA